MQHIEYIISIGIGIGIGSGSGIGIGTSRGVTLVGGRPGAAPGSASLTLQAGLAQETVVVRGSPRPLPGHPSHVGPPVRTLLPWTP